ncbi:phosphoribosylanthranilate isomerase [Roseomonas sp. 18066]|uniref:phosphoribosylanthranilate isomerase n=1 Tax=Roseomonas sp. 18066 TaxID=2681412 RepID=UPI00135C74BA|nr:phosphoribosylanthranilate isomerase [Roseomonas sp. 18066]
MPDSHAPVQVKICGINDAEAYDAACRAGADLVGFVFYPPSPRYVSPEQAAALAGRSGNGRRPLCVGLFVDPDDALIAEVLEQVPLGLLQLHGEETPERCAAIRARFGLPVMKALGIGSEADLDLIEAYAPVVDRFLLDAKAPPGASLPGGNAVSFDWSLLAGRAIPRPWMLAGGLTPLNIAQAIRATGATAVDASSGLERLRGVKDPVLIAAFIAAAHSA